MSLASKAHICALTIPRSQCSKIWTLNDLQRIKTFGCVEKVSKIMCAVDGNKIVHFVALETLGKRTQLK